MHAGHWHRIPVLEISLMRISLQRRLFNVKEVQGERERTKAIAMHKLKFTSRLFRSYTTVTMVHTIADFIIILYKSKLPKGRLRKLAKA